MLQWIKNSREIRLALAVCAGLLLYRLIVYMVWACWYYSLLKHIDSDALVVVGFYGGLLLLLGFALRRLWRSHRSKTAA